MAAITLTGSLRGEYQRLFDTCVIRPGRAQEVEQLSRKIGQNRQRYEAVSSGTGVPWYFIALIHCLEASFDFRTHLHNGDPLEAPTVRVPAGRPLGPGPFTWEQSAQDALRLKRLHTWTDWTVPGVLYKLEGYNGFGYRRLNPKLNSPYLWSFSNHYSKGKYVADGRFSPSAISRQCGCAVLFRRLVDHGLIG
jgi:lysozyme family protein